MVDFLSGTSTPYAFLKPMCTYVNIYKLMPTRMLAYYV